MEIKKILICGGGGLMGRGFAHMLSANPALDIMVYDIADNDFRNMLRKTFDIFVEKGIISADEADERTAKVGFTADLDSAGAEAADLVLETIFEDMSLKKELFAKLEERCRPDCIFCTNTSVMSPTEISAGLKFKGRFVGTHFFNPSHIIPLVEIVKSDYTNDETVEIALKFFTDAGKKAVRCNRDVPGFIGNRLQHAMFREALYIVNEGIADAATVDEVIRYSFGMRLPRLGPMENMDMVGLDLNYNVQDYLYKHLCNSQTPMPALTKLKDEGKLGFKTNQGFYTWDEESKAKSRAELEALLIRMIYGV